jgi:hypothetical protein
MIEPMIPTIERTIINGKRHYNALLNGKDYKGISVTTLTDLFDPKPWKKPWYLKLGREVLPDWIASHLSPEELEAECLKLGEIEGNKVGTQAAKVGTTWHEQVEDYYANPHNDWQPLFQPKPELFTFLRDSNVLTHEDFPNRLGTEIPVVYSKDAKQTVGGTCDVVLNVNTHNLSVYKSDETLPESLTVVGDWKFPSKPKYPDGCLGYFLQLAIYREAIKFTYDITLNEALLLISPNSTNKLYIYYVDSATLDYYFNVFEKMLWLYAHDLVHEFNWMDFAKTSKENGFHGKRLVVKNHVQNT